MAGVSMRAEGRRVVRTVGAVAMVVTAAPAGTVDVEDAALTACGCCRGEGEGDGGGGGGPMDLDKTKRAVAA